MSGAQVRDAQASATLVDAARVIAIDGPAASGKGTLARRLATHLGRPHLDTGLLYRAVAWEMIERGEPLSDPKRAAEVAAGLDVARYDQALLRARHMGEAASIVSAFVPVRDALLALQRRFASQPGGAVLDGRDIATVVCPEAAVKLFVTASPEERARRRFRELAASGEANDYGSILTDIERRDARDLTRGAAPLRIADDAFILDTTDLDQEAAFERALAVVAAHQGV